MIYNNRTHSTWAKYAGRLTCAGLGLAALGWGSSALWAQDTEARPIPVHMPDQEPAVRFVQNKGKLPKVLEGESPRAAQLRREFEKNQTSPKPSTTTAPPPRNLPRPIPRPGTGGDVESGPVRRDPTRPNSDEMEGLLQRRSPTAVNGPDGKPLPRPTMPSIEVKARLLSSVRPPIAMLQIGNVVYRVRENHSLRVGNANNPVTLKVEAIDTDGIKIFVPELEQHITIN